ncbi:Tn7 transposase TnsA N-terminal domain-containing protein [Maritalea mobilis]|uniref:Tn7 transposase TnsA N-terminal domain-containing protein n=1 Tax=Maritalea mobilis TaxID=483324 RepID=UPI001C97CCA6|nr:Tn7 transposase TnsA N-terminal domain-containing protein [Maritalea mobilis]MBY6203224.1 Tn7 transposase TnsA N-terminal domain-containing protein [Maritalea mobilis]
MPKTQKNYVEYFDFVKDNDTWWYAPQKLPRKSPIELDEIHGVLGFDGVRNPSSRSNTSHKVFIPYRTPANDWVPKVGIAESAAEAAVSVQVLLSRDTFDLHFQPLTVEFQDEDGRTRAYTHDLLITLCSGHRRLVFVRNESSLEKPRTMRDIAAISAATPKSAADDLIVVNANDYTRQRRENLFRMYAMMADPDPEADEIVWQTARNLRTLYHMKDLFPHVPISQRRAFRACYRLVAQGALSANLDHVLWEHSRLEVAA